MAGKIPPPPAPPAPKSRAASSEQAAYNAFINAHPNMLPYSEAISKWAKTYGVDRVVAASLFWRESFAEAKRRGVDPATIMSPTGAGVGIGQINPIHVGERTPWGHTVTRSDLNNPEFNIRWSMWYFGKQEAKYGSADAAYSQGYNPGYTGAPLTSLLPKGYVPRGGLSPADKGQVAAEQSAATAAAKAQVFDKWAILDPKGHVKFVNINDPSKPPKGVLTYGGIPLTQAGFTQNWGPYADTFFAYTGRQATGKEIASILRGDYGISTYAVANKLATQKGFQNSPVWKQHAPGLIEYARSILGENWKPSGGIIRQAIAQNWDQATFQAHIRHLPAYVNGPEFKTNLAQNQSAFEQIYGKADTHVQQMLKEKTLAGWTPDELQSWLRSQPAYVHTTEYQSKSVSFLGALGLVTGKQATLSGSQVDQMLSAGDSLGGGAGTTQAPNQVSENGKGGGNTPRPVPVAPAPQLVSEHGMGGGYR